jgi:HSP20 family protein
MAETRSETRDTGSTREPSQKRSDVEQRPRTERETGSSIARRQPSGGLSTYRDPFSMMRRLMEDFGFGGGLLAPAIGLDRELWTPQIEVFERDGKLIVSTDLPGLKKDDVRVEVKDNVLTIEGERRDEHRDEQGRWSERTYGRFYRSIALPEGVNADSASATFNNGVLEITLDAPQRNQQRGRQIEVREQAQK